MKKLCIIGHFAINKAIHKSWIAEEQGDWVKVKRTRFNTVFANDIR